VNIESTDALSATTQISSALEKLSLSDKIVILNLSGIIEKGKTSDIDFNKIELLARKKGAFSFIKSTSRLHHPESEILLEKAEAGNIESLIIEQFVTKNQSKFNDYIPSLISVLQASQMEEEKSAVFEDRLYDEIKKVISI